MHNKIQLIQATISTVAPLSSHYIDEVNNFPSVSLLHSEVSRTHIGAARIKSSVQYRVRGYTCSSIETSLDDSEALARQLETAIQSITGEGVYSSKVIELHTDEGLFAPYGICDLLCTLEWLNE